MALLVGQMAQRYPSQDLSDSLEGYLADFEQLAVMHTLPAVQEALAALRIRPGQSFFPRPDEVATEIEKQRDRQALEHAAEIQQQRRANEITAFWEWAPWWMEQTGNDEAELLRRFPSMKGTRA